MTKSQQISLRILTLRAEGLSTRDAFNAVLGEGAYERLASELYVELRAKGRAA